MKYTKKKSEDFASILDSDDELPDSYVDAAETPAYLNNTRYNGIELPWLNNCNPVRITQKNAEQNLSPKHFETKTPSDIGQAKKVTQSGRSKIVISRGVLTACDLYVLKSIAEYCTESTVLWFIDTLKMKAATDRPRIGCLAMDYCPYDPKVDTSKSYDSIKSNYYLKVKICS